MTFFNINPLTGAPLQGGQVQEQQAAERARQVRRSQAVARNVAAQGDCFEHQVESSEQLGSIHDDQQPRQQDQQRPRRDQKEPPADDPPHLDLKA